MRSGPSLPGSAQLIQELCARFRVSAEDDDLLWRVYDRAVEASGESEVYAWFRQRFWNVVALALVQGRFDERPSTGRGATRLVRS